MRHALLPGTFAIILAFSLVASGCTSGPDPAMDAREALGTVVTITAYPVDGASDQSVTGDLDATYQAMANVENVLDAHSGDTGDTLDPNVAAYSHGFAVPATSAADFNDEPRAWRTFPAEILEILETIDRLAVFDSFSPWLLEVTALYDLEGDGTVPDPDVLQYYVDASRSLQTTNSGGAVLIPQEMAVRFDWSALDVPQGARQSSPDDVRRAGLDLGGAAKGFALDRARETLSSSAHVTAALITAGSTTVTFGSKPDQTPWRIGIEHPRDPEAIIATVEADDSVTVSTSGDYQRFFERDGTRYHHILDPATGRPASGLQSLTVVGAPRGLESDILATALFVMGPDDATRYAEENRLGLILVDAEGRVQITPGPEGRSWKIIEEEQ